MYQSHHPVRDGDRDSCGDQLALPWGQFYADSLAVRAERPDLSDEQFAGQQSRFLAHLLDRETLYRTKFFRSLYEDVARANIARYVRMLGATEPGQ